MPLLNPRLGIDFSNYIADRTENFTGREWVFEAIQNWLADSNSERFFLLTGEPGSGKTAIAARLAQFAQGVETYPGLEARFLQAVHFCSVRDSVWTDPKEFARSLALQLAQSIPEFGLALKDVEGKTTNIKVEQTIGAVQNSNITGVIIQNLTILSLTGQEAFTQVVVNPLRQIQQEGFNQPVTILVDSLDEALTHDGESTIVSLLSKLSTSIKLRLILTSRNEGRVKDKLDEYEELFISAEENLDKNQKDVRAYIDTKFRQEETLQSALQTEAFDQETLTTNLIEKSEGNFLYVRFLLESVALGQQSFTNLDGLPQGLDELYYSSLVRVVELGKKDWSEVYAPVMGVLLAAQESLTESQIRAFTKLKESVVWDCLNDLQQFLDEIEAEDDETQYKLYHQSVTDFLGKRQLVIRKKKSNNRYYLPGQEQHQRLLEYYRPEGKPWSKVQLEKIDLYGRRHIAQHLVKADRVEELHTLLSLEKNGKNAWFKLKDDEGDTAGFLIDVALAWAQADEAYEREPEKSIGLQCRYALIEASINTLARIPTKLMIALIKHNYWKPTKVLAYARQIPEPEERFEGLKALAAQLPDSEPLQQQALQFALQAAQSIRDASDRAEALIALADRLPEALPKALEAALAIQREVYRAEALIALADRLPEALPKALEAILAIGYADHRADALTALADRLPEALPEVLEAALAIEDESSRARALIALADKLTPDLLPKALEAALAIQSESYCAEALIALADKLTPDLLPKALEAALAIQSESYCAEALTALADKLTPDLLPKALEAALAMQYESHRASTLTALADRLPEALPKALEAAIATQDEFSRARALIALADRLTPDLLPKALEVAIAIQHPLSRALTALANKLPEALPKALEAAIAMPHESYCAEALIALADRLTPDLLPKALEAAIAIRDASYRARALTALADRFPEALPKALEAAIAIQFEPDRSGALTVLVDRLTPDLLPKALEAAIAIQDWNNSALTALADRFPEALPKALEAAIAIEDESSRARALIALTGKLTPDLLPKALEIALAIEDKSSRARALTALTDRLPEALPQALEAAIATQDEFSRAHALIALTGKLTPDLLPKALEAAIAIGDASDRAFALTALADRLPEALPKALEAVLAIQREVSRAEALIALADRLLEALPKALEAAQAIQIESHRARALTALAFHLANNPERFKLWKDLLHFLSHRTRPSLLNDLATLTPVIVALGGESAAAETAQAIQDVARWWA